MKRNADNDVPAANKLICVGLIRVTYQGLRKSAQLLLVTAGQLAIETDQSTLGMRKLVQRRCRHFNVTDIGVFAIQHAYHSIKCIADALIWGLVRYRSGTPASIHSLGSVISYGFEEASNRSLIILRNTSVLLNNAIFNIGQRIRIKRGSDPFHDVKDIEPKRARSHAQVRRGGITCAGFVVSLRSFGDTKMFRKLILRQPCLGALLAQPRANLFGECQYFSIQIFTLADFCHILRLSSHENARNCTMPNSTITEQARQLARASLEKRGQTAKNFAALHNLNASTVYAVLNGQSQCRRGEAHRAAVLLGIKEGVIGQ